MRRMSCFEVHNNNNNLFNRFPTDIESAEPLR